MASNGCFYPEADRPSYTPFCALAASIVVQKHVTLGLTADAGRYVQKTMSKYSFEEDIVISKAKLAKTQLED
ncbi:hypothetical protein MNBD_GAMMA19-167, partial [hydrothermal vent metagenome]